MYRGAKQIPQSDVTDYTTYKCDVMIRTQIQLTERQHELLKRMAREENASMAELIRRAVDLLEKRRTGRSDEEIRERAKAAIGRFHSDRTDVSRRHDDYFADSILP